MSEGMGLGLRPRFPELLFGHLSTTLLPSASLQHLQCWEPSLPGPRPELLEVLH